MSNHDVVAPAPGAGAQHRGRTMLWAGAGGVAAAFMGSLCCMGPLLFVTLGVGASLAGTFEPLRPVFAVLMLAMFAVAFYAVYGRRRAGASSVAAGGAAGAPSCAVPHRVRRRDQVILWAAVALAILLWTFPTWSVLLV